MQQNKLPKSRNVISEILMPFFLLGIGVFITDCHANCKDPNKLSPQMRKAYFELKKSSKELGGFSVGIRCYNN